MTQRVLILEDQPFQRGFLANLFGSRAGVQSMPAKTWMPPSHCVPASPTTWWSVTC